VNGAEDAAKPGVVVGLGNPGAKYARNRHNAGFMTVDWLARETGPVVWQVRWRALVAQVPIAGRRILLVKPQTYMNVSGACVAALAGDLRLGPQDVVVVLDDISLPFARIRVRARGSAGGHHGLASLLDALGTDEVPRVRLGVGEEDMPAEKADFVLADFPRTREEELNEMIGNAVAAVRTILGSGVERAMSDFNA
jgi:PTH1 family peptidyl-tRNA hydrolase